MILICCEEEGGFALGAGRSCGWEIMTTKCCTFHFTHGEISLDFLIPFRKVMYLDLCFCFHCPRYPSAMSLPKVTFKLPKDIHFVQLLRILVRFKDRDRSDPSLGLVRSNPAMRAYVRDASCCHRCPRHLEQLGESPVWILKSLLGVLPRGRPGTSSATKVLLGLSVLLGEPHYGRSISRSAIVGEPLARHVDVRKEHGGVDAGELGEFLRRIVPPLFSLPGHHAAHTLGKPAPTIHIAFLNGIAR